MSDLKVEQGKDPAKTFEVDSDNLMQQVQQFLDQEETSKVDSNPPRPATNTPAQAFHALSEPEVFASPSTEVATVSPRDTTVGSEDLGREIAALQLRQKQLHQSEVWEAEKEAAQRQSDKKLRKKKDFIQWQLDMLEGKQVLNPQVTTEALLSLQDTPKYRSAKRLRNFNSDLMALLQAQELSGPHGLRQALFGFITKYHAFFTQSNSAEMMDYLKDLLDICGIEPAQDPNATGEFDVSDVEEHVVQNKVRKGFMLTKSNKILIASLSIAVLLLTAVALVKFNIL